MSFGHTWFKAHLSLEPVKAFVPRLVLRDQIRIQLLNDAADQNTKTLVVWRAWSREGVIPLFSVQSLYVVELKLPLRTRLARQTHAQPVEKSIASLALRLR